MLSFLWKIHHFSRLSMIMAQQQKPSEKIVPKYISGCNNGTYCLISKQIVFSRKSRAINHGGISFNNTMINRESVLEYFSLLLSAKFNFVEHIKTQKQKSKMEILVQV